MILSPVPFFRIIYRSGRLNIKPFAAPVYDEIRVIKFTHVKNRLSKESITQIPVRANAYFTQIPVRVMQNSTESPFITECLASLVIFNRSHLNKEKFPHLPNNLLSFRLL